MPHKNTPLISASIVLYKPDAAQVQRVINSYSPAAGRRLYLIDNSPQRSASADSLHAGSSHIDYRFTGSNIGYGAAHNIALRSAIAAGARYHIALNPDLSFQPDVVDAMAAYMDAQPDVVEMMPKVLNPDGTIQYLCKLLPTPFDLLARRFLPPVRIVKRANDRYTMRHSGYDRIMDVPCLSGCFMFMRLAAIAAHNIFFDERFFMYCEDFDLVRRLGRVGRTLYFPNVQITHLHQRESYRSAKMLLAHIISAIKYFNKWGWLFDHERKGR